MFGLAKSSAINSSLKTNKRLNSVQNSIKLDKSIKTPNDAGSYVNSEGKLAITVEHSPTREMEHKIVNIYKSSSQSMTPVHQSD